MRATVNLPESMKLRKWSQCRWCSLPILTKDGKPNKRRLWHEKCSSTFLIATQPRAARRALRKRDKTRCAVCGVKCDHKKIKWEADHILPLWQSKGELRYFLLDNIQTLCLEHHRQKTKTDMQDYLEHKKNNAT